MERAILIASLVVSRFGGISLEIGSLPGILPHGKLFGHQRKMIPRVENRGSALSQGARQSVRRVEIRDLGRFLFLPYRHYWAHPPSSGHVQNADSTVPVSGIYHNYTTNINTITPYRSYSALDEYTGNHSIVHI